MTTQIELESVITAETFIIEMEPDEWSDEPQIVSQFDNLHKTLDYIEENKDESFFDLF